MKKQKIKQRKQKKKLSVCIEPELDSVLDEGGFNKSKLINKLLIGYLKKHTEGNKEK